MKQGKFWFTEKEAGLKRLLLHGSVTVLIKKVLLQKVTPQREGKYPSVVFLIIDLNTILILILGNVNLVHEDLGEFYIEVIPAGEGFVGGEQQEQDDAAKKETDPSPESGEDQQHDTHEFYCITQFKVGLGIVGNGYKSHI